jgi:surface antigen
MALGKSLTVVSLISLSLSAQANDNTVYLEHDVGMLYKFLEMVVSRFGGLNSAERTKHQQAMYHALNNLDNGVTVKWYSDTRPNHGSAEVVATASMNGMLCRRIYSFITTRDSRYGYNHWACYDQRSGVWNFSDK